MGWTGVLGNIAVYARLLRRTKSAWRRSPPDAVVLIDCPGFNLRIARMAHSLGIPVYYYVCPQVWAWGSGRLLLMRRILRMAFPVLPFEEALYRSFGIRVVYPGHPLREVVPSRFPARRTSLKRMGFDPARPLVVMLPGSRDEEISRHLSVFLRAAVRLGLAGKAPQFAVVAAPGKAGRLRSMVAGAGVKVRVMEDPSYKLRACADLAWTASGTSTLELGLMGIPQILVYRGGWINWLVARIVIRVRHVGLVNLILGRSAVTEIIQWELREGVLHDISRAMLRDKRAASDAAKTAAELDRRLSRKKASREVAASILSDLRGGRG